MGKPREPIELDKIFQYVTSKKYPPRATGLEKRAIRRSASHNFKVRNNITNYGFVLSVYTDFLHIVLPLRDSRNIYNYVVFVG
jgi:hypothetical protein